jgi:hypothetical protein
MKRPLLRILLVATVISTAACNGDEGDPDTSDNNPTLGEFSNCRVIQIDRAGFDGTTYTYDEQGRLKTSSFHTYTSEYSYLGNQMTGMHYSDGDLTRTETIDLNSAGLATHVEADYVSSQKTTYIDFEYDTKNHLVKRSDSREGSAVIKHRVYQWVKGNMVAESDPDGSDMTTYTYTDEPVHPAEWFNVVALAEGYFVIRNKNRISSIINSSGDTFSHQYSTDENGMVDEIHIDPSGSAEYTQGFSFECD